MRIKECWPRSECTHRTVATTVTIVTIPSPSPPPPPSSPSSLLPLPHHHHHHCHCYHRHHHYRYHHFCFSGCGINKTVRVLGTLGGGGGACEAMGSSFSTFSPCPAEMLTCLTPTPTVLFISSFSEVLPGLLLFPECMPDDVVTLNLKRQPWLLVLPLACHS